MSKPTKGFLNDWKPKKPRSTKSTALVSCSTSSSSSCVFPFKYMNRYSTVQYSKIQYMYMNRIFTSCTVLDGDTQPWCATSLTADGQGSRHCRK